MTSIIVPAHNEEKLIGKCLAPFVNVVADPDFEVIVVCNGCTDQTAQKVSELSKDFICIETETASKTNALNIGDQIASSFPRFYVDSDVRLSLEAISAVSNVLNSGYLAAAPQVEMDFDGSSWFVKAFYDVLLSLPYTKAGMIGAGVYALSREGRGRFMQFPAIIADDGYVRCLFSESERGLAKGYYSVVHAPRNLAALIKIKTRSRLGRYELKQKYPEILKNEDKDYVGAVKELVLDVKSWPKIFVYLFVNIVARVRAGSQFAKGISTWERDDSRR